MLVGFCGAGVVVVGLGPLIVHLLTLGIHRHEDAAQGARQTWVLLLLVVPQIILYGVAAVGVGRAERAGGTSRSRPPRPRSRTSG